LTLHYPERDSVKRGIKSEVMAYIDAIMVLGSLRGYLVDIGIECFIEKKIMKKEGGHKIPDLLIRSQNYLVVDHKYTESTNEKTLTDKVTEIREYDTTFVHDLTEFKPEIVMLTPKNATELLKKILGCPITWGYTLNEEIVIDQSIESVKDSKILSLFKPVFFCPKSKEVSKYKFIISHSPLPYTSCIVYTILWTLNPPTDYFTSEFDVNYDIILDTFNHLFPPWLSPEVKQLNDTRLKEALALLQSIGWIKWLETEKMVIFFKKKGRLAADTLEYLIDRCADIEYAEKVQDYEREKRIEQLMKAEKETTQRLLVDYL